MSNHPIETTMSTLGEVFGNASKMPIPAFIPGHPDVPVKNPLFVWTSMLIRDLSEWINDPAADPLLLTGPTGCGKTEALLQFFSGINQPTIVISCNRSMEPDEFWGGKELVDSGNGTPTTEYRRSGLMDAYANGYAIIFDENDALTAPAALALHRLLERANIALPNGDVVKCHPSTRVCATANTRGDGDTMGRFAGANQLNSATMNRYLILDCDYPPAEVETQIIERALPEVPRVSIDCIVKVAIDIRTAYEQGDSPTTMSIRDMLRWARCLFAGSKRPDVSPIYHAFNKAVGNRCDAECREVLHRIIKHHFGVECPAGGKSI